MTNKYSIKYYKNHFREKMEKLLEKKYPEIRKHNRVSHFTTKFQLYLQSKESDISESTIKAYMSPSNRNFPPIETLADICNFLDVDMDYFLTEQEDFNLSIKSFITGFIIE